MPVGQLCRCTYLSLYLSGLHDVTRAIQRTDCYHTGETTCLASTTVYIAVYGVVQIFISQIPNFGELWWLSYVAAIMSFTYSFLGLGLGIEKASRKCK